MSKMIYSGEIIIGNVALPCGILDDEDRTHILSERGLFAIFGMRGRGARGGHRLVSILGKKHLKPLLDNESWADIERPIRYYDGKVETFGYKSTLLGRIAKALSEANRLGLLRTEPEKRYAIQAEILRDALVNVAVDALIDEATGYQDVREKGALANILEKYIAQELQEWTKTFPYEFYKQIYRLKGWGKITNQKKPGVVGHYTNDIIYDRLAPGLLDELRRTNPILPEGYRKNKHHQWLTPDLGHPKLKIRLEAVIALMRASTRWDGFRRLLQRAYPKHGETPDLFADDE